jgi:hypothetical protein
MASFGDRIVGAMKLDVPTFEEIERDTNAMGQAIGVIVIAAVASAVGAGRFGIMVLPFTALASLVGYLAWSLAVFLIGTKLMPEPTTKADFNQTFRVVGFAAAPGLFSVLGILPLIGGLVRLVVAVWTIAAMVIAVRQVLDYTTTAKAVVVCLIGFAVFFVINVMFVGLFAGALIGTAILR